MYLGFELYRPTGMVWIPHVRPITSRGCSEMVRLGGSREGLKYLPSIPYLKNDGKMVYFGGYVCKGQGNKVIRCYY